MRLLSFYSNITVDLDSCSSLGKIDTVNVENLVMEMCSAKCKYYILLLHGEQRRYIGDYFNRLSLAAKVAHNY